MGVKKENDNSEFLLEIGTEELPVGYIEPALAQLKELTCKRLEEERIRFGRIHTFATPRRLIIYIREIAKFSIPEEKKVIGPALKLSFDEENKPTSALLGFMKSQGATLEQLKKERTSRGEYICLIKKGRPKKTEKILSQIFPEIIKKISFPKLMHWDGSFEFARPIRWLLAIWGNKKLSFSVGKIKTDNLTYGLRQITLKPLRINSVKEYFTKIKDKGFIIIDSKERLKLIDKQIEIITKKIKAKAKDEGYLIRNEINYLLEYPVGFLGRFDSQYLRLPQEVLFASMSKYQRVIPLVDKSEKILPFFIGFANARPKKLKRVKSNYEFVLNARLWDSLFFFKEDTREPLERKMAKLKELVFQRELGSIYDKTTRLIHISGYIGKRLKLKEGQLRNLERASLLSKVDLLTNMVKEFPSLQGRMGYYYALNSGENIEVARAIGEHYLPRFAADDLPHSLLGAILSFADKFDLILGCFAIGSVPSGSFDPYGLRRAGIGIWRVALKYRFDIAVEDLIEEGLRLLPSEISKSLSLKENISKFLKDRLEAVLSETFAIDLIDAVINVGVFNPFLVLRRLQDLSEICDKDYFQKAVKVIQRTQNILKNAPEELVPIQESLLQESQEKLLWEVFNKHKDGILEAIKNLKFKEATRQYGEVFFEVIHEFFDKVLVNCNEESLRVNRLRLLREINRLYSEDVADLARVKSKN